MYVAAERKRKEGASVPEGLLNSKVTKEGYCTLICRYVRILSGIGILLCQLC